MCSVRLSSIGTRQIRQGECASLPPLMVITEMPKPSFLLFMFELGSSEKKILVPLHLKMRCLYSPRLYGTQWRCQTDSLPYAWEVHPAIPNKVSI